jgi:hypothetical protein
MRASLTMGDNYYIRHGLKFLWYLLTKIMKSMIHFSQIQAFFFIMKRKNLGGGLMPQIPQELKDGVFCE